MANETSAPRSAAGEFAKKCADALIGLEPRRSREDIEEIHNTVRKLAQIYGSNEKDQGPEVADKQFQKYYESLQIAAETNRVLGAKKSGSFDLGSLAEYLGGMNLVQAQMIGGVAERVPLLGLIGKALTSAANLEKTLMGVTGRPQVFGALGDLLHQVDAKLKQHGFEISGETIRSRVQQLAESPPAQKALESAKGIIVSSSGTLQELGKQVGINISPEKALERLLGNKPAGRS